MTDSIETPAKKANKLFSADQRDKFVRDQLAKERAESHAKTTKLRALRLAKEAAEREAQPKPAEDETEPRVRASPSPRKRVIKY